ncbi:MAG TPA: type II secretion system protein [Gallionella sp.]
MKKQAGFTLIELVMVIVILGILAAVALPKFVNLGADARDASLRGVAGTLSSANTINYAFRSLHPTSGVPIANCNVANTLLEGGVLPGAPDYTLNTLAIAAGSTVPCTLTPVTAGNLANTTVMITGI